MPSISIIICFYNAGKKLIPTLKNIQALKIEELSDCELILVNNNSSDNSCQIIENTMKDFTSFSWKIVAEPNPGLSNARLKGIMESKNELILFCDDDNWLDENYAQKASKIMEENQKIAVLGGFGTAVSDIPLPGWFEENQNYYAVGPQMPENGRVIKKRNVVYGAGMVVRRSAWQHIVANGFKFLTLGRTGKKLSSGEDGELCLAFQVAGFYVWYDDSLKFRHYIEPSRLTKSHFQKLKKGIGSSGYVAKFYLSFLNGYTPNITPLFWVKEALHLFKDLIISLLKFSIKDISRNYNYIKYILSERSNYNKDVASIANVCKNLSKHQ